MSKFKAGDKVIKISDETDCIKIGDIVTVKRYKESTKSLWFEESQGEYLSTTYRLYRPVKLSKDDLKDGDKIYMEKGSVDEFGEYNDHINPFYVCGELAVQFKINFPSTYIRLSELTDNLVTEMGQRISKIVRDKDVLFQREDEVKEVTLKLTQAQIDSLKEQGVI